MRHRTLQNCEGNEIKGGTVRCQGVWQMKGSPVTLQYEVYVTQTNTQKVLSATHVVKEAKATLCSSQWTLGRGLFSLHDKSDSSKEGDSFEPQSWEVAIVCIFVTLTAHFQKMLTTSCSAAFTAFCGQDRNETPVSCIHRPKTR